MRKIAIITGTRAEYGLLYWIIKGTFDDPTLELQLIVTCMHLSPEFGLTVEEIEKDGFPISDKVEMLLSSDTEEATATSMGLGMIGFAKTYKRLRPDIIAVLGDRFEILAAVAAAVPFRIPVAHIHGGEITEGAMDELFRHAITKMSHLHFAATEQYRKRIIQLGEQPDRVFNVGSPAIDNIKRLKLLNRTDFEKSLNFKLNKKNLLVTYHPVTLEHDTSSKQFKELLGALDELSDTHIIFTKANSDTHGRVINQMIGEYIATNRNKAAAFDSLGNLRYLSAMKHVDAVVGNSSSGLIEAPSFKIGTINIGDRQKGRIKPNSVINCLPSKKNITESLDILYSDDFRNRLKTVKNPYGDGGASKRMHKILKTINYKDILKKRFFDFE